MLRSIPKTEYVLNPLQAEKEIRIGNYYFKKGSNKAAVRRYEEARKWDPNSAEGWYKLGEAKASSGTQRLSGKPGPSTWSSSRMANS